MYFNPCRIEFSLLQCFFLIILGLDTVYHNAVPGLCILVRSPFPSRGQNLVLDKWTKGELGSSVRKYLYLFISLKSCYPKLIVRCALSYSDVSQPSITIFVKLMSIFSAGGMPNLMTLTAKRTAASFFRTELSTIFLVSNHCHTSVNFSPRVIYAYTTKFPVICLIFNSRRNCTLCLTWSSVYIIPLVIHWYATEETVLYILHFLPCISPHQSYIDMPQQKLYFMFYMVFRVYHPTSHTLICHRRNCTIYLTFSSVYITPPVIHWYATEETVLYVLHGLPCISPHQSYLDMPQKKLYYISYIFFRVYHPTSHNYTCIDMPQKKLYYICLTRSSRCPLSVRVDSVPFRGRLQLLLHQQHHTESQGHVVRITWPLPAAHY